MKYLLIILALFVGNIFSQDAFLENIPNVSVNTKDAIQVSFSPPLNFTQEITLGDDLINSRKEIDGLFLDYEENNYFIDYKNSCKLVKHENNFLFSEFSLQKSSKVNRDFLDKACVFYRATNFKGCKRLARVAYCLPDEYVDYEASQSKVNLKDGISAEDVDELEVYEFLYDAGWNFGHYLEVIYNNVKKKKNIKLKSKRLKIYEDVKVLDEFKLKLVDIEENNYLIFCKKGSSINENPTLMRVKNFSDLLNKENIYEIPEPYAEGLNSYWCYKFDSKKFNEMRFVPQDRGELANKFVFEEISSNSVKFKMQPYSRRQALIDEENDRKEMYLAELIDRCIDIYMFVEETQIKACVQREAFNDKQLAMQQEQIELLQKQNRTLANQQQQNATNNSIWLGAFIGALTGSAISNTIQSNEYQNKINNLQRQINQNRTMNNQQNWRTTN